MAGFVSLGFVFYTLCAAFGITALVIHRSRARRHPDAVAGAGAIQIAVSVSVNAIIAAAAGSIAVFLAARPGWLLVQRWLMGTVLAGLAVRMAAEARR